jgi:S-adenosylmethionine decarboxylase
MIQPNAEPLPSRIAPPGRGLVGCEWAVDAIGCCPSRLREPLSLQAVCEQILGQLDLHVVGRPLWHQFPEPGGVTGLYLLSESHLACHTYPEYGLATFNLYCCRTIAQWPWLQELSSALGASQVDVTEIPRGRLTSTNVLARVSCLDARGHKP